MKKITVLGVTGSIGTQTIDVVTGHPDEFEIVAMSAGHNIKKLEEIMNQLPVPHICVLEQKDYDYLSEKYPDRHFYLGQEGLIQISTLEETEIVLNAIVGFAGLLPTIEAIKAGKDIALANKETLVVAGHIIIPLAKKYGIQLLPVDSEHSAIFQSMHGEYPREISKILLTCSGGSFRDKSLDELKDATVEELHEAIEKALVLDRHVLVEERIFGRELTVAVLGAGQDAKVLPIIEIIAPNGDYDYQNKYFTNDVRYECPAKLSDDLREDISRACLSAYRALGARGWSRIDLILSEDGSFNLLEMNTSPGMTAHSLVPLAAKNAGMSYQELVLQILSEARLDFPRH